jgi:8-oxo-dGTP pyrophosphatase MutT (NUDIX family)
LSGLFVVFLQLVWPAPHTAESSGKARAPRAMPMVLAGPIRVGANMQLQGVLTYLAQVQQLERAAFTPLFFADEALGCVNAEWQSRLLGHEPELFFMSSRGMHCRLSAGYAPLSAALHHAALRWRDAGWLHGWRDENFLVCHENGAEFFELERAAFRPLGLTSHAVHLNGLTRRPDGAVHMWLGRRSLLKAVDPDRMDNMVGGGVAAGESIDETREREGWEEAGLAGELLAGLPQQSLLWAERAVARGLHREWLHVFDVWLTPQQYPLNQDGEVAEHVCLSLPEVESLIVEQRFMIDAALVAADCLARLGYWGADGARVRQALSAR